MSKMINQYEGDEFVMKITTRFCTLLETGGNLKSHKIINYKSSR